MCKDDSVVFRIQSDMYIKSRKDPELASLLRMTVFKNTGDKGAGCRCPVPLHFNNRYSEALAEESNTCVILKH